MPKEILLTQGKVTLVDDEDFEWLNQWKWHASRNCSTAIKRYYYANRVVYPNGERTTIAMHRLILNAPKGTEVDHIDGDTLNNQRGNLRFCTRSENQHNQRKARGLSKFKGVSFYRESQKWGAKINVNQERRWLGLFDTEELAAQAYDNAARIYFGQFACTNQELGLLALGGDPRKR